MSETTVNMYNVYCKTDSVWKQVWGTSEPTKCPDSDTHIINSPVTHISNSVEQNNVTIKEEKIETGGNYAMETIAFDALPNQITTHSISYPFPINVINAIIITADEHRGDNIKLSVAPKTTVGLITADVTPGDNIISVSSDVLEKCKIGFKIFLDDGNIEYDCGRVIAIDTANSKLTVENAIDTSYLVSTLIKLSIRYVTMEIGPASSFSIGASKIGTSHFEANKPIVAEYENKSKTETKRFIINIEFLY